MEPNNTVTGRVGCRALLAIVAITIGLPVLLLALIARGSKPAVTEREVARVSSPDGRLDAIIAYTETGTDASRSYWIGAAEKGKTPGEDEIALAVDQVEKPDRLKIAWKDRTLLISVSSARVLKQEDSIRAGGIHLLVEVQVDGELRKP